MNRDFPDMTTVVPEGTLGEVQVEHFTFTKEESDFTKFRAAFGHPHEFCPPGRYARLLVNGQIWMTDTKMERDSNREVLFEARGQVLLGGLGLGMVAAGLLLNPTIEHITVVERHPHVLALVGPALWRWEKQTFLRAGRLELVSGDIFDWTPPRGVRYDAIYLDVWQDICRDNLDEVRRLKARYRRRLAKGGWIGAWMEDL